jgi:hypothetical protein
MDGRKAVLPVRRVKGKAEAVGRLVVLLQRRRSHLRRKDCNRVLRKLRKGSSASSLRRRPMMILWTQTREKGKTGTRKTQKINGRSKYKLGFSELCTSWVYQAHEEEGGSCCKDGV